MAPSARAARLLRQFVDAARALSDDLAPHFEAADELSLMVASLFAMSSGAIDSDEAIARVCDVAPHRVAITPLHLAVGQFAQRVRHINWPDVRQVITASMGDGAPYIVEALLAGYDPATRRKKGIYFTPAPIVRFLVRSTDALVRRSLSCVDGLAALGDASHPLRVVDPACGTGVFLREVLRVASQPTWSSAQWECMARRCYGFDIVPANIAAARWFLAQPREVGSSGGAAAQLVAISALAQDSENFLPQGAGPLVILGNPPYANFGRQNCDPWIMNLLTEYREGLGERKHNLADDYIKFFRWAQHHIERAGSGIVAFVTNHAFLTAITHRQMRQRLLRAFDQLYVLDLGGQIRHGAASKDENVFGIRAGVSLNLFVRSAEHSPERQTTIRYAAMDGDRESKLRAIDGLTLDSIVWTELEPRPPMYWLAANRASAPPAPYGEWPRLDEIFCEFISGVQTKNDALYVDFDRDALAQRMRGRFGQSFDSQHLRPYIVAPFDQRWIYYDPDQLGRSRYHVMKHMLHDNVGLVFMRQSANEGPYDHFLAVRDLISDRAFYSVRGAPFLAPLWLYDGAVRRSNLSPSFVERCAPYVMDGDAVEAEVFAYIYGIVHDQHYRERWDACLRSDFPRIPCPEDPGQFERARRDGQLRLHRHLTIARSGQSLEECRDDRWWVASGYPRYEPVDGRAAGCVWVNADCSLPDVHVSAWEARIGGYPVLPRWLKQRRRRWLTPGDQDYVRALIAVLSTEHSQ